MSKTEYDEFQKQNLYSCLDANLAFHYTESLLVQKLFNMMKSTVWMPYRKAISRKILDSENDRVFTEMIAVMKAHSDSFGGFTLAVDSWKNMKKQSQFGQMLMCAKDYLFYYMEDVTSKHTMPSLWCRKYMKSLMRSKRIMVLLLLLLF